MNCGQHASNLDGAVPSLVFEVRQQSHGGTSRSRVSPELFRAQQPLHPQWGGPAGFLLCAGECAGWYMVACSCVFWSQIVLFSYFSGSTFRTNIWGLIFTNVDKQKGHGNIFL